jgi:hypothetical protein
MKLVKLLGTNPRIPVSGKPRPVLEELELRSWVGDVVHLGTLKV